MNLNLINETIRATCNDIKAQVGPIINWQQLTEEELFYEVAICIFSSQMLFELAVATADRLQNLHLFRQQRYYFNPNDYRNSIIDALDYPIVIKTDIGTNRSVYPRFKNRFAYLLSETVTEIYGQGKTIRQLLYAKTSSKKARESLIEHICGFGPKQASLFLRRIGYCTDLAVLDTHVLDYLQLVYGGSLKTGRLAHLPFYEKIENLFVEIASDFGYSIGCVDLATWLTIRVMKKEGHL